MIGSEISATTTNNSQVFYIEVENYAPDNSTQQIVDPNPTIK